MKQKKINHFYLRIKSYIVPDDFAIKMTFRRVKGYSLNYEAPRTFSEKLCFLKAYYYNPLTNICADKYYSREYVNACGLERILKRTYGVYNCSDEINLDTLPDSFFMKCNHGNGDNFYIKSKDATDFRPIFRKLDKSMKNDYYWDNRERCYKGIEPRILIEEPLINEDGSLPIDYKFYCFSGEPKYLMISYGEYEHKHINHKFDMNMESIDHLFKNKATIDAHNCIIPDNIREMIELATVLCKPFPHVRVDLYNVKGKIYLGELTFYTAGGYVNIESKEFDLQIGSWIDLKKYSNDFTKKGKALIASLSNK